MDDAKNFFLSNFQKIKLLKQNSKGEVWLATDFDGLPVILKKINLVGLPYNLLKENPNALYAKIFFTAEIDNQTFVVEEFIAGENFFGKTLSTSQAKKFILQLCDGLIFLHKLGIVHRDIKPSNLILQNENFVRLIDFDAARIFKPEQSQDTKLLGTPNYAPPEQFGFGQTDSRSDIFALGKTFQELLGKNCRGNLKKILQKCTELDPKNRFQSVEELKFALLEKKSLPLKKFFIFFAIAFFSFQKSAVEEKISQPVKVEKIPVQENLPEVKKNFQFPEIKLPVENSQLPEIKMPENLPQKNKPTAAPEKIPEIPAAESVYKNCVKVKYFWNGARINAWTDDFDYDVNNAGWQVEVKNLNNFQKLGDNSLKFPAWKIEVKAENLTANNFLNAQVEVIYSEGDKVEKKILHGANIPAGGEKIFTIQLNEFRVNNPAAKHTFKINFSGSGAPVHGSSCLYDLILNP